MEDVKCVEQPNFLRERTMDDASTDGHSNSNDPHHVKLGNTMIYCSGFFYTMTAFAVLAALLCASNPWTRVLSLFGVAAGLLFGILGAMCKWFDDLGHKINRMHSEQRKLADALSEIKVLLAEESIELQDNATTDV